jgi:signal transduction histidine kinase
MTPAQPVRILYMEDDEGMARLFQRRLSREGYNVDIATDGKQGLAMCQTNVYDVVVVDHKMPVYNGLEVIKHITKYPSPPSVIMVTGAGDEQIAVEALKLGASDYLVKDVNGGYLELLPTLIEQVLHRQQLIQEKQQADEALRQYAAELEIRNAELDAFAHTVAHDLKNPLNRIVGFADVAVRYRDTMTENELQTSLNTIEQNARKMSNIIDELLLLSSVRKQEITPEPLEMRSIIAEACQRLEPMVVAYEAQIIIPDIWPTALGYDPWIEQVWINYLSNALKYGGDPPEVELGYTHQTEGMICFWVRDNGEGLTPDQQAQLFTPYTRLTEIRVTGHGLGLSIVRRIVEKLNGQVGVESKGPGQGSTFTFTLPVVDNCD